MPFGIKEDRYTEEICLRSPKDQRRARSEQWATGAELEAIFGWTGGNIASHYTRTADRSRLARKAIGKLANNPGTSIPAPSDRARATDPKSD